MISNLQQKKRQQFNNETAIDIIKHAVTQLGTIGVLEFLRWNGAARIPDSGRNSSANAAEGARASGYAECLEDLEYFIDKFILVPDIPADTIKPHYGAYKRLVDSGDYTKEEIDEFRRTGKLTPSSK